MTHPFLDRRLLLNLPAQMYGTNAFPSTAGPATSHVQRTAEFASVLPGDRMFFTEQLEDGDARFSGAVIVIIPILADHINEPDQCLVERLGEKEFETLTIPFPPDAGRKALRIHREAMQACDGSD